MIKKIKKSIYTLVCSLVIGSSSLTSVNVANASGFPTVDIANLVQQLMNYLNYMQQLQEQIQHTKNQIENLKEISVPSIDSLKNISYLSQSLQDMYDLWNKYANEYNELNETYEEYSELNDKIIQIKKNCSKGIQNDNCNYKKIENLKLQQKEIKDKYFKKIREIQKDVTDENKRRKNILKKLNAFNEDRDPLAECKKTANTSGKLQACQLVAFEELMKQNYELQLTLIDLQKDNLDLTLAKEQYMLLQTDNIEFEIESTEK